MRQRALRHALELCEVAQDALAARACHPKHARATPSRDFFRLTRSLSLLTLPASPNIAFQFGVHPLVERSEKSDDGPGQLNVLSFSDWVP